MNYISEDLLPVTVTSRLQCQLVSYILQIGMLSLGYPKTNFQVANDLAYNQLLQYMKEKVQCVQQYEVIERPFTPADTNQKQMAFKVKVYMHS